MVPAKFVRLHRGRQASTNASNSSTDAFDTSMAILVPCNWFGINVGRRSG
jgi:hypothetical protein